MSSTLERLFAPGQRIPELDTDDLNELADLVLEELARRAGEDLEVVSTEELGKYRRAFETAQHMRYDR